MNELIEQRKAWFLELYKDEYPRAVNWILAYQLQHTAVAEDIVQNTFIDMWFKIELSKTEFECKKQMQKYFYKAITNKCVDYRIYKEACDRKERRFMKLYTPFDVVSHMDNKLQIKLLKKAITKLPGQCKTIFALNRIYEVAGVEIAFQMKLKRKTVYSQLNRATNLLKKDLGLEYKDNHKPKPKKK